MKPRYWKNAQLVLLLLLQFSPLWLLLQAKLLGAESDAGRAVNLAVFIEGQVSVKRKGWTNYAPVAFGTSLRIGDLLHLDESSRAKVVCSDLTLRDISPGIVGVPCEGAKTLLRRPDGSVINATRSWPSDGSFPLVLSPRKTRLLSAQPVLRWTPVKGTTNYQVIVRGIDGRGINFYWSRVYSGTEIRYPDSAPPLEAGVDYKLIVETSGPNSRSSSDEPGLGLGFSVLGSKERKTVLEEEKQIENLGLPAGPTQFLIAHLYATHDLNAEAIQRLEGISNTFKVAAVARLLGDLYLNIGLPRQAETNYLNSLDLSRDGKDEEGQMLVHLALASIYGQTLGNVNSASEHLNATLALANKLGDDYVIGEVGKRLTELKKTGT
jgi:hypothetical protein